MKITFHSSTGEVISELGSRIKAARIAMPATQKEMAAMTNLSPKTISNLETGKDVSFPRSSRCCAPWDSCRVWS